MNKFILNIEPVIHNSFWWVFTHIWGLSDLQQRQLPVWEKGVVWFLWALIIMFAISFLLCASIIIKKFYLKIKEWEGNQ